MVGCRPTEEVPSDVEVTWQVTPDPPRVGSATVTMALADSLSQPIQDARITLEGTMTHPGMQPVLAEAHEVAPGLYEATLDFTMRGDWMLLMHATLPDSRSVQRQKDVPGVRVP